MIYPEDVMERQLKKGICYGVLLLLPLISAAQISDSKPINDLLRQTETHAMLANHDAELLESYTRATAMSWQSHANRLISMKEHANNLIEDFNKLSSMKEQGSPWQKEAIERVAPLVQEMSTHLTATIRHLNDNKPRIHMPPYRDYAKANREYMSKTSQLISDFVEYGETRAKVDSLESTLELEASAQAPTNE